MANYVASARSNAFRVKDVSALEAVMPADIEVYIESLPENKVCLLVNGDDGGWPSMIYDEATDEYVDWDVEDAVAPHLLDGEWCVTKEVGAEKLRYLIGHARAFNNKGESHYIDLDQIFSLLPDGVSTCDY